MVSPVVVVGGGTAGCTVVSHLASHTDRDVVLVEPGGVSIYDDHRGFHDAVADSSMTRSTRAWVTHGGPTHRYCEARALGGGSAINGMILSGEPPAELAGLTRVADSEDIGPVGRALLASGGEPSRLWWNGGRWNPGRAVAHLAEEGRISIVREEVVGVVDGASGAVVSTSLRDIEAHHVVMCTGAIATPAILLASGFGVANTAIGTGLQNHPMVSFALRLRSSAAAQNVRGHPGFDAAVVRRDRSSSGRDILVVGYERASVDDVDLGLISSLLMRVESQGRVVLDGAQVVVDFNVLSDEGDIAAMREAVNGLIGLATSPAVRAVANAVSVDDRGTPVSTLVGISGADLDEWIRVHVSVASHATSSCARAVDEHGRLIGAERVWVADASVLPTVPNCTPAAPVTMEARRIAHVIGESVARGN